MLSIFFSWIIISFILFSFGNILLDFYNKICKQKEKYNILDTMLLGMCFITIPLSIWSLWLPSNHIFLAICFAVSVVKFIYNKDELIYSLKSGIKYVKSISKIEQGVVILFFILMLISIFGIENIGDSLYYHHQNIRWNEEYAVVPGLGNLDDKFAFNSNYLLLSAIFTFRFLFGQALYPLLSLFFFYIGSWLLIELFKSKYELKRVIVFTFFSSFFVISLNSIFTTSTDLIPNLFIFYIVARLIFESDFYKRKQLLLFLLPVFLITYKLTVIPLCLLTLLSLIQLVKERNYKSLVFLITFSLLIMIPWLARNVILSGYLIYPLYQIDLFSFDWKLPKEVAVSAKEYILYVGHEYVEFIVKKTFERYRDPVWVNIYTIILYFLSILSFFVITIVGIKKLKQSFIYLYTGIILTLSIIIWILNGPDMRFVAGIICIYIAMAACMLFSGRKNIYISKLGMLTVILFIGFTSVWTVRRIYYSYQTISETNNPRRPFSSVFYKPYLREDIAVIVNPEFEKLFEPYQINNGLTIYISYVDVTMERLPATVAFHRGKFTNYKCLEARGYSLQDGFRLKQGCK